MIFGTFDRLHPGHLDYIRQARKHGSYLIAIVARDCNVEKIKGVLPKNNEQKRLQQISQLPTVDHARFGHVNQSPLKVIIEEKPDVICLGYDQNSYTKNLKQELEKHELYPRIIRLKPFNEKKFKSSKLS